MNGVSTLLSNQNTFHSLLSNQTTLTKMAAVTKRAQGPPTRHILASEGPSSYPLHFYSTTYSVQHSRNPTYPSSSFRHKGTGYVANFRPSVFYNRDIDKTQTPSIA